MAVITTVTTSTEVSVTVTSTSVGPGEAVVEVTVKLLRYEEQKLLASAPTSLRALRTSLSPQD